MVVKLVIDDVRKFPMLTSFDASIEAFLRIT
jgi:hypothetical protein